MSQSWCVQLIKRAAYHGDDGTTRRSSSCLSWPDAQRILSASFCRPTAQLHGEQAVELDCAPPAPAPQPVQAPAADPVQPPADTQTMGSQQAQHGPAEVEDPAGSAATTYPDPAAAAAPTPERTADPIAVSPHGSRVARQREPDASSKIYTGVLIRGRNIMVAPRTFAATDCPRALDAGAPGRHPVYLRCLSLDERQRLLSKARCEPAPINQPGTRRYACQEDPAPYLDDLSQH